jgi:TorA maturation chaperone TorD
MRDLGLRAAIESIGGVSELARRVGISQPSVSNWDRVPAERVLAVESATGVSRLRLRPDLYPEVQVGGDIDEIDVARAQEYGLLATLLARAPCTDLLKRLSKLGGDSTPLGVAHIALNEVATKLNADAVQYEFFNLFVGVGRGELLPYGSFYLTGFLNERPLARLRADLAKFEIARVEDNLEPEDHAATLCEIMSGLAAKRFPAPAAADRMLFEKHLAPWIGRFFTDLECAQAADFYSRVGALGRIFIEIEAKAFALGG